MSDIRDPAERHPSDEPDGTPAYAASLRQPGQSLGDGETDADTGDEGAPDSRTGYDADAVSGDTEIYRPD